MTQLQLYAGQLALGGEVIDYGQVWVDGDTAVFFRQPGGGTLVLNDMTIGLDDSGKLQFTGTTGEGPATWVTVPNAHSVGTWANAKVMFDPPWEKAMVTWTQYSTRVSMAGHEPVVVPGGRTRQAGNFGYLVAPDGSEVQVQLNTKSGCGCGR